MKLKAIAAVCALAFAGQAFAAAPTPAQAAASQNSLFISGSSALQNTIGQIANGIFTAGTVSVFEDGSATVPSGNNYRAYAGTFSAAAGAALAGQTGVVYETAKGGSIMGVVPVALAQNVNRIDLTTCGAAAVGVDSVTGAPLWSCTGAVGAVPDAGVSDVEPAMFVGINVPAGTAPATPAIIAALTAQATLAQPMSIIVTPNTGITNLSKAQVTGLMGGLSTDWSFVDATYAAGPVIVCKRTAGSGTQASINDFFFGFPCTQTTQKAATYLSTVAGGYTVIENTSSGALGSCMTAAQNGLAAGATIDITSGAIAVHAVDATHITLAAGGRAIGLMGLDRPPQPLTNALINGYATKTTELYQPISIGGAVPSVVNASLGGYDVVVNNSWNKRAGTVGTVAPLAGNQLAFFNAMAAQSGNKTILGTTKVPPVPGVAALADPVNLNFDPTLNADGTFTNPVMRTSKSNSCQPAIQVQ